MNAPSRLRLRPFLLIGCAACGLAAGWSGAAGAQAFQATPSTVFGSVTYNRATPGVETITVNSDTAVINWTTISPTNPFIFLPAGNVATFQNGVNNGNFVALNRILVNVPVRFDGRVISQLVTAGGSVPGGTLLFSTPGGIIVGANAVFDVGNLVLTSLDVNVDGTGNFYDPATRGFTFTANPLGTVGPVVTEAGARINAPGANSYVALVAPSITHGGNIQVNGAAAFIAGQQVEMRANDGLFDIIVPVGTGSATPITHNGTTGGPASTGAADIHRIYMVAVPRNQAITALLQGNVGFDQAVNASVENGAIVLSAGYNVVGGSVASGAPLGGQPANFTIAGGNITSDLFGYAVTNMISGGNLTATQDLTLVGGAQASLSAAAGEQIAIAGNFSATSSGGSAYIASDGGANVTIGGNAIVDASSTGVLLPNGDGTDAQGGVARIVSTGGNIRIAGNASVLAVGTGASASSVADTVGRGGNGTGGDALVQSNLGGSIQISGNLVMDASGVGGSTSGYGQNSSYVDGGIGTGGDVSIVALGGGTVSVTGSSALSSNGRGGNSLYTVGGEGEGDDVVIEASGGSVTLTGPVAISAIGTGGSGVTGGQGEGGELSVSASDGIVVISGDTIANLTGTGGSGSTDYTLGLGSGNGGNGGDGEGGAITFFATAGTGAIDVHSFAGRADGVGGNGGGGIIAGSGGNGTGGDAVIVTQTNLTVMGTPPRIHFGALSLSASGTGGDGGPGSGNGPNSGGAGGLGNGGEIIISASQAPIVVDGQTRLTANGTGGATAAGGGNAPSGAGGTIAIAASATQVALGNATIISANGVGGAGPNGGFGVGGTLTVEANVGDVDLGTSADISATGTGGAALAGGTGGDGGGGTVTLTALAGAADSHITGGTVAIVAAGTGGAAGAGGPFGGNGTGGSVTIVAQSGASNIPGTGNIALGALSAAANGTGGQGASGGTGTGGGVAIQIGGTMTVTGATSATADGRGGAGGILSGGAGKGGEALVTGAMSLNGDVLVRAAGIGGDGPNGGNGSGGTLTLGSSDPRPMNFGGTTTLSADGRGGAANATGGRGGDGAGGTLLMRPGTAGFGAFQSNVLQASASGTGGAGDVAGRGGDGRGGSASLIGAPGGGSLTLGATTIVANGTGGAGGVGGDGTGGIVAAGLADEINENPISGTAQYASLELDASGTGGAGSGAGRGGTGRGGSANLSAPHGVSVKIAGATIINLNGTGGAGPDGGLGVGGTLTIEAREGDLDLGTSASFTASGTGGAALPGGTGGEGDGGTVTIAARSGAAASHITGGTIAIAATGTGGAAGAAGAGSARGGAGVGGTIAILAESTNGNLALGAVSALASGTGGDGAAAGGSGTGGTVTVGTVDGPAPTCSTPAACAAATTGGATFASLDLSAIGAGGQGGVRGNATGGTVTLQSIAAPTIVAGAVTMRADADSEGMNGGASGQAAGGLLVLSAAPQSTTGVAGRLQTGSIDGSANAIRAAATGNIGGRWQISASGGSSITAADVNLVAFADSSPSTTPVSTIDLAGGILNFTGIAILGAGGDVRVNVANAGQIRGGSYLLQSGRDVTISHANRGTGFTVDAVGFGAQGTNISLNAGISIRASSGLDFRADNLITIAGPVAARNIFLASADLDIPGTGFVGDPSTQEISIEALPLPGQQFARQIVLGGTTQGPGYTLTNAEFGRLRTTRLDILTAPVGNAPNRIPDLVIRDLTLTAPGTASGAGVNFLSIIVGNDRFGVDGVTQIEGALSLANAGATSGISLNSTDRIQVATPTGSVRVRDAVGAPGGTLDLIANNIWVTNQAILTRLLADAGYATRDAELADNGGTQAPRGYIEGGTVTLSLRDSLFVQNSGENDSGGFSLTGPAYGGITVGPGGLVISAGGTVPASVTAFGRRINADGSVTTGDDFFFAVDFRAGAAAFAGAGGNLIGPARAGAGSATGYTPESTFNACVIVTGQCPTRRPDDTGPRGPDPIIGPSSVIQLPPGADDDDVDTSFATEPLIEEPVTSGGESTLWTPPCDPTRDRACVGEHP